MLKAKTIADAEKLGEKLTVVTELLKQLKNAEVDERPWNKPGRKTEETRALATDILLHHGLGEQAGMRVSTVITMMGEFANLALALAIKYHEAAKEERDAAPPNSQDPQLYVDFQIIDDDKKDINGRRRRWPRLQVIYRDRT